MRCGGLLSYSELARDCGVSVDTARRWLEYLNVSFQTILLEPWSQNLTSRVTKSPKLYWTDLGLLRRLTGRTDVLTGEIYENHVVAEIHKWIRTAKVDAQMFHYRTVSGMEVDLLLETPFGVIGCEIKMRDQVEPRDARHLVAIAQALGDRWRGGMVIHRGRSLVKLCEPGIWAVPSHRLLA